MSKKLCLMLSIVAAVLSAGSLAAQEGSRYLVVFKKASVDPAGATALVEAYGGAVVDGLFEIGVAVAAADDPGFPASLAGEAEVESVTTEVAQSWLGNIAPDPVLMEEEQEASASRSSGLRSVVANMVTDPTQARLFDLRQWNLKIMRAPEAWAAGHLGEPEVTVALVDTGIDYTHQELAGTVDLERSVSFVPEDDALLEQLFPGAHPVADLNFHGTYNAGLIACNAIVTACVAPNVTLVGVKVLNHAGQGTFGTIARGIVYAAEIGADVINLSIHITVDGKSEEGRQGVQAIRRAVNFAHARGSLVISEVGVTQVGGIDADHNGHDVILPAEAGPLAVSASDRNDEFSNISDFGRTLVDIASPGGTFSGSIVDAVLSPCSTFSQIVAGCRRPTPTSPFRYVFLTGFPGTAPQASGAAALVDSRFGGTLRGVQLRSILLDTAVDLGSPGFDPFFGRGRVDAFLAVQAELDE